MQADEERDDVERGVCGADRVAAQLISDDDEVESRDELRLGDTDDSWSALRAR